MEEETKLFNLEAILKFFWNEFETVFELIFKLKLNAELVFGLFF